MASRIELIEMCGELEIPCVGLSINKLKEIVREEADKKLDKKYPVSADNLSATLKRFLCLEYNYEIHDMKGNKLVVT